MQRQLITAILLFLLVGLLVDSVADEVEQSAADPDFRMTISDRFRIASGGVVITGVVEAGTVSVQDTICIHSEASGPVEVTVTGMESFNKLIDSASSGDRVGLLVTGIELDAITVGDRLTGSCD